MENICHVKWKKNGILPYPFAALEAAWKRPENLELTVEMSNLQNNKTSFAPGFIPGP